MSDTWQVVVVESPAVARTALNAAALSHSDWVRLFLGRALAPAKLVGDPRAPTSVEYLVLGTPIPEAPPGALPDDLVASASNDFARLATAVQWHRALIANVHELCEAGRAAEASPEYFLASYAVLSCVTVSMDPQDWVVTDEGLSIVRWGLAGERCRPLLGLANVELEELRARVLGRAGREVEAAREAERRAQAAEKERLGKAHHAAKQGASAQPQDAAQAAVPVAPQSARPHPSRLQRAQQGGAPGLLAAAWITLWVRWALVGGTSLLLLLLGILLWRWWGASRAAPHDPSVQKLVQPSQDPPATTGGQVPAPASPAKGT